MHTCLNGAMSLYQQMLGYYQLDPWEQTSVKLQSKYKPFHSRKCFRKHRLRNGGHFVQGRWVNSSPPWVSVLTLSIVVWGIRQWPSTTKAASFLLEYVTSPVCKHHQSIAPWNLFFTGYAVPTYQRCLKDPIKLLNVISIKILKSLFCIYYGSRFSWHENNIVRNLLFYRICLRHIVTWVYSGW